MCSCCYKAWRSNAKTENESRSSSPEVSVFLEDIYEEQYLTYSIPYRFFEIFAKYDGYKHGHIKLKRPKQLQEILDTARSLLAEIQHRAAGPELEEKQGKLEQLKSVLEMCVNIVFLYIIFYLIANINFDYM